MSKTKHTPGPWLLETESRHSSGSELLITDAEGGANIADCRLSWNDYETACANARLVAAAPELLEALKVIRNIALADAGSKWAKTVELECEAAIAKAEGK